MIRILIKPLMPYLERILLCCIVGAIGVHLQGCGGPPLKPWHTERLTAEFTTKKKSEIQTFDDYRQLEDTLFAQLEEKIYNQTGTGPGYELVRYSSGSSADPQHRRPNWNRSFELPTDEPAGGVLLLHGMSDSPYSLRALGEVLNKSQYWVIGPRLPGHGTAPSGLKSITWEDMAAVVGLGVRHLAAKVGNKPIHIIGYSTGAPLALNFALDALEGKVSPLPASLVLISPAIGVHPMAGLAGFKNGLARIPGLGRLAWLSILPEFDPYKYNSFATNAGSQVHRITRSVAGRIVDRSRVGSLEKFPPTLVFKSTVDATVSTHAVVDRLLNLLGPSGHELILFDINRVAAAAPMLISDPGSLTSQLLADDTLPFTLTVITNENPKSIQVTAHSKDPFAADVSETAPLGLAWPPGVISLSHVALPFPPDDPLYGQQPPDNSDAIFLGQMAIKGERGLLKISYDWLLRLRNNPFFDFLERRTQEWLNRNGERVSPPGNHE
jgi:alpha-beta hydrolase superfamily lysophospholipase